MTDERERLIKDTEVLIERERGKLTEYMTEISEYFMAYIAGETAMVVTGSLSAGGRHGDVMYTTVLLATQSVEVAIDKAIESAKTVAMVRDYNEATVTVVGNTLCLETASEGRRMTYAITINCTQYR